MHPQQLAALLATEIDSGFGAALTRLGASRALVVDRIRTRVGALPEGKEISWDQVPWVADVELLPTTPTGTRLPGHGGPAPTQPSPAQEVLAAQPVSAIRGVGSTWATRLETWGYPLVGDLASAGPGEFLARGVQRIPELLTILARARILCAPWPADLPSGAGRTLTDLATTQPESSDIDGFRLWDHCIGLLAALDVDVARSIRIP
ncbi:MAG TPA: hypothetical protein GXZ60_05300 [Intrasporangiaceae bacterium]|nr:hypothetical protein [Intrasporangiaceae bacterium]